MVRLLVIDFIRRMRGTYVWCWALLALVWPGVEGGMMSAGMGVALSMSTAFVAGPVLAGMFMARREVVVLPVSARQVWLARWIAGTVVASLCTTTAKITGMFGAAALTGSPLSWPLVMLSGVWDFAYAGAFFGSVALFDLKPGGPKWFRRAVLRTLLAVWLGMTAGGVAWPVVFRAHLATAWPDLAGVAGVGLLAALALTFVGYRHVPSPGGTRIWRLSARPAGAGDASPPRITILDRFTGPGYFLWREAALWLIVVLAALAGMYALVWLNPSPARGSALAELLEGFSLPLRSFPYFDGGWFLLLMLSCFPANSAPSPRHLRTLPLSTVSLNALVLAVPFIRWLTNCLVVGMLFVVVSGSLPQSFRWDLFLWFLGLTALAHALQLRSRKSRRWPGAPLVVGVFLIGLLSGGSVVPVLPAFALTYPLNVLLAGVATMTAAALLNHATLTRHQAIYRPAPEEPA